jgi:molybdopterin molybdotransferase
MISVNEARKILADNTQRGKCFKVPVAEAAGYITCSEIISPVDVPSFDNSAMDGYAVAYNGHRDYWNVVTEIPAGTFQSCCLNEGEAARIFTGSPMPEGVDTVIPQELIERNNNTIHFLFSGITKGTNVRYAGSQVKAGERILNAGSALTPGNIGLLASVGIPSVEIYSPLEVSVIVTGNELCEPGELLQHGKIYNSNGPMLEAAFNRLGIKKISTHRAADNEPQLRKLIEKELEKSDAIIISGGISVGDYDFVKTSLAKIGVSELFYKLKQRPGKPFYAGKYRDKWVFALPGNPASVFSCFNQFIKPCLKFSMGHNDVWLPDMKMPLTEGCPKKKGFTFFMKALREKGKIRLLSGQQSFNLIAFANADCFIELEEEVDFVEAGTLVNVYLI